MNISLFQDKNAFEYDGVFFSDIFPINFDGAKLMVNKGLSNHFQISHTLNMSSVTMSGYRFGATYVGTKQFSPSEASI